MQLNNISALFAKIRQVGALIAVFSSMMLIFVSCAGAQVKNGYSEAFGFLAKEQSLGENYAVILKDFGKEDLGNYAEGIALYANAKAEYDGLIQQLKYNLKAGRPLDSSSDFQSKLETAADQRVAFTSFVTEKVISGDPNRKNPAVIAAIAAVPELVDALTKVTNSIWQEYRSVNDAKKREMIEQLESFSWKPFQDIGKGN